MQANQLIGLPGSTIGYSPNLKPNNSQTIFTNEFDINAVLSLPTSPVSTIYPGYFLSKANAGVNDLTFVLPTAASVTSGNLWIATEGVIPDTLNNASVQGDTAGAPTPFVNGLNINVVPFPENGTVMMAWVYYSSGHTVTPNEPLYVREDGTLTFTAADADITTSAYSVGYVMQSSFATAPSSGLFQMQVVINPRYILQD